VGTGGLVFCYSSLYAHTLEVKQSSALIGLERVRGFYFVLILITLLLFCILKSLYVDNHNNPRAARVGRATDVPPFY
jgi:hypothetical protein